MSANSIGVNLISDAVGTGTYLPMTFYTGGSERMRIDKSGNVTIKSGGSTTATHGFYYNENGGEIHLYDETGASATILDQASNSTRLLELVNGSNLVLGLGVGNTTGVTQFLKSGYSEAARIDSSGNVLVTNPAGLGYGTGAGGTVTQATSKSTAVTLNKPTGEIVMNASALAAGASVNFDLNNNLINPSGQSGDTLLAVPYNNSQYRVEVASMFGQVARIRVTNLTGVSLSEALIISFAVIKGARV